MIKLTKPILMEIDEGYSVPVEDFRQYARCMMYPDPTGVDMSEELNELVTNAVNEGKTTLQRSTSWSSATARAASIIPTVTALMAFCMGKSFCASAMSKLPLSAWN